MAKIKTYTDEQYRKAKKMKFKSKKPKKPKRSASLNSINSFINRYNNWVDKMKDKAKQFDQKEADKKKKLSLLNQISRL